MPTVYPRHREEVNGPLALAPLALARPDWHNYRYENVRKNCGLLNFEVTALQPRAKPGNYASKESRQMKRTYQIDERRAIEKVRCDLVTNPGSIQMVVPLAEVAQRLRHGVSQMLFETEREPLMLIMLAEAALLSGSAALCGGIALVVALFGATVPEGGRRGAITFGGVSYGGCSGPC
jgi:hypothetical protein